MYIIGINHAAIICSNIETSKRFYTDILGGTVVAEEYRSERCSHKVSVALPNGLGTLELFTFPHAPSRLTYPEALGLRHLAFDVEDVEQARNELIRKGVSCEEIRSHKGARFFFIHDPDGLPIELTSA